MLTPPNYLRRDPSNVTDDTEARHTAHTAAGLRHEEAVLLTRILVGIVAVTTFVTHKHPFLANFTYYDKASTCGKPTEPAPAVGSGPVYTRAFEHCKVTLDCTDSSFCKGDIKFLAVATAA